MTNQEKNTFTTPEEFISSAADLFNQALQLEVHNPSDVYHWLLGHIPGKIDPNLRKTIQDKLVNKPDDDAARKATTLINLRTLISEVKNQSQKNDLDPTAREALTQTVVAEFYLNCHQIDYKSSTKPTHPARKFAHKVANNFLEYSSTLHQERLEELSRQTTQSTTPLESGLITIQALQLISALTVDSSGNHHEVLKRYYFQGQTIAEIAINIGMDERTVRSYLTRAQNEVKQFLISEGISSSILRHL